ncbi:MAG: acyl-CoA thioesterase [Elusimicrobia bacterium]|nr:acyl-CoA thioesterase [Elusimicrobiota bacterium]
MELPARFSDLDALGHVNNAVYLSYLEEARVAYLRDVLGVTDARRVEFILARVEIDYRSPVVLGETVRVAVRVTRIGGASFDAEYELTDKASGRLVAQAKTVQVWYDFKASKVSRVPAEVAAAMRRFDSL